MYLPEQFKETSPERIAALIESHSFGMLVTAPGGAPFVSHLPFIFDRFAGSKGKLFCHMARANPQWQHFQRRARRLSYSRGRMLMFPLPGIRRPACQHGITQWSTCAANP